MADEKGIADGKIELKILTTPGCAHCRQAKDVLARVKPDYPELVVEEIDITQQPEAAARYGVFVSPAVIINGEVAFAGGVREQELRAKLDAITGSGRGR